MSPENLTSDQRSHRFINNGDPSGWFEVLYANANGDERAVPWDHGQPHPSFLDWAERNNFGASADRQKALVVACGLGHDAEALVKLGFQVTAFDISPTAVAWCRRRFPGSEVEYHVADLFDPPAVWLTAFDFVLDIYTIQALPPAFHQETVKAISRYVAPGGSLLACYLGRSADVEPSGPPWPLARAELDLFQKFGLQEVTFEDYVDQDQVRRFRALYQA